MHRSTLAIGFCAVLIAAALLVLAATFSSRDRAICTSINRQNAAISMSLERAKTTLPTLAYYRSHPQELNAQLAEIQRNLNAFKPLPC